VPSRTTSHNLARRFQFATGAPARCNGPKRTYRRVLESLRTLRYELLNVPAKLGTAEGRPELRITQALERLDEAT
jgi:hypothetical protein